MAMLDRAIFAWIFAGIYVNLLEWRDHHMLAKLDGFWGRLIKTSQCKATKINLHSMCDAVLWQSRFVKRPSLGWSRRFTLHREQGCCNIGAVHTWRGDNFTSPGSRNDSKWMACMLWLILSSTRVASYHPLQHMGVLPWVCWLLERMVHVCVGYRGKYSNVVSTCMNTCCWQKDVWSENLPDIYTFVDGIWFSIIKALLHCYLVQDQHCARVNNYCPQGTVQCATSVHLSSHQVARVDLTWGPIDYHRATLDNLATAMKRVRRLCAVMVRDCDYFTFDGDLGSVHCQYLPLGVTKLQLRMALLQFHSSICLLIPIRQRLQACAALGSRLFMASGTADQRLGS